MESVEPIVVDSMAPVEVLMLTVSALAAVPVAPMLMLLAAVVLPMTM